MLFYEPLARPKEILPHDPFKALIAPRPIGWVSTISASGAINLAPYSYFNAFATSTPIIGFSSEGEKDSLTFARETREFVWNIATYDLRDAMNASSSPLPRGQSEFPHAGLTPVASRLIKPPRVGECPASFECKVTEIIDLKDKDGRLTNAHLVLGEVVGVHIDEAFIENGIVDITALMPLARCGYADYVAVREVFSLKRPG